MNERPHTDSDGSHSPSDANLLALVSEELRGPLTSVSGFLQILLDGEAGDLTDGQARIAETVARNARKMTKVVDDLIVIAQMRGAGMSERRVLADVAEIVRERVFNAGPDLEARRASVGFSCDPCPRVYVDAPSVEHMIDQMLHGAVTFVPLDGHIQVEVHRVNGGVSVAVSDDGGETDVAAADHLLKGEGIAQSPRALVGSRMGMQLVREVARAHGGDAFIASGDGRTTVTAVLASEV